MKHIVTLPVYIPDGDSFEFAGAVPYELTYWKGVKPHQLAIVVNGYFTKEYINIENPHEKYRHKILLAIKQYRWRDKSKNYPVCKKAFTKESFIQRYNKKYWARLETYLFPISKFVGRDTVTKYNLIHGTIDLPCPTGENDTLVGGRQIQSETLLSEVPRSSE